MAHAGGRPLKFESIEELQTKIDAYFADCDPHPEQRIEYKYLKKTSVNSFGNETQTDDYSQPPYAEEYWGISHKKPYTITGLANFLHTSRETLINYEDRPEFFDTIRAAKDKIEEYWEHNLIGANVTGIIFNLKNNYGWRDKTEQENSGEQKVIIETRFAATDENNADDD